jgi:predicted DCC family thiol-disulfide oxidoreductase YuxK
MKSRKLNLRENTSHAIILFDGVCNLCNFFIDFIIRKDRKGIFRFTPLQSAMGHEKIMLFKINEKSTDSVILLEEDKYFVRSTAALRILLKLHFPWSLMYVFILIPRIVRDPIYDCIARNRYQWFGKRETCRLPSPEEKERFF